MTNWLGKLFAMFRPAPRRIATVARRNVRARYDAAATNEDNRRHWAAADGLSAATANTHSVRQTLRNRSRYEFDNNGYCGGMIRTLANDLAGTGPTLQMLTVDDQVNEQIESAWREWCRAIGWGEKVWTLAMAKGKDGEGIGILVTNRAIDNPVKLDLSPIEADQVADPYGFINLQVLEENKDNVFSDGIEYDRAGNPVSYVVLRNHPGDNLLGFTSDYDRVPAKFVIHWFRRDRPGQLRGVPEVTSSLPIFSQMRRWTLATLTAAETAADFAAVLETEGSPNDDDALPDPFDTVEIDRGMMATLPSGAKLKQFAAEQPAKSNLCCFQVA